MKYAKFLLVGIFFGVVLTKSEAVSWYRIFEMFQFQSFHMYGILGSAVVIGALAIKMIKGLQIKDISGSPISITPKAKSITRYLLGGTIFGLGWALTGACPGPLYILIGNGLWIVTVVLLSAIIGTFVYGLVKNKLPH